MSTMPIKTKIASKLKTTSNMYGIVFLKMATDQTKLAICPKPYLANIGYNSYIMVFLN